MQKRQHLLIALLILSCLSIGLLLPRPKGPGEDAKRMLRACQGKAAGKESCYVDAFTELTKNNPIAYSLRVLSAIRQADGAANGCHFIAHVIATTEVRKNPAQWESVLGKIPASDCTGGFIMGVMEGHKLYDKHFLLDSNSLGFICRKVGAKTGGVDDDLTCAHTMGHLLLVEKKGDVAPSIEVCERASLEYRYECAAGVFMENLYRRNLFAHGVGKPFAWNGAALAEQEKLCSSYSDLPAKACWRELSHMYVVLEKTPQKVFASCSKAGVKDFQDACFLHAVGVMTLLSGSAANLAGLCVPYATDTGEFTNCIDAVSGALLDSSSGLYQKASDFCKQNKAHGPNCQKADLMVY